MLATTLFVFLALSSSFADERDARGWFDRSAHTVTRMVTEREVVTELLPSSCVVVQTSLPSCRHLRAIPDVQPARPQRILQTQAPYARQQAWKPIIQPSNPARHSTSPFKATPPVVRPPAANSTSSGFWSNWNIFNFGTKEVVVTSTVREVSTTKYMDPNTVVTFSVKGCRPSRLPFDLPECHQREVYEQPGKAIDSTPISMDPGLIVMAPIQLVPNMKPISVMDHKEPVKEPVGEVENDKKEMKVVGVKEEEPGEVEIEEAKLDEAEVDKKE